MNSRISIDVNEQNQPVIFIDYKDSGDVRDKLVKRFMQGFGTDSSFARIEFIQHPSLEENSRMVITPVSEVEVSYDENGVIETDQEKFKFTRKITKITDFHNF